MHTTNCFCYASPILPGKTQEMFAFQKMKEKMVEDPVFAREDQKFWQELGLKGWNPCIQETPIGDYFIRILKGDNFEKMLLDLQRACQTGHPIAKMLQNHYLTCLGEDLSSEAYRPTIAPVVDFSSGAFKELLFERAYLYPLRPEYVEAHQQSVETLLNSTPDFFEIFCEEGGMIQFKTWIQKNLDWHYLIIYEGYGVDEEEVRECELRLRSTQEYKKWSKFCIFHTGLALEDLRPEVQKLKSAAVKKR